VDAIREGENPHVNYEPSSLGGLKLAQSGGKPYEPYVAGNLTRTPITKGSDFKQAGELWRSFSDWEKQDTVDFIVGGLKQCTRDIQERMVQMYGRCDAEYGRRVAQGLGIPAPQPEPQHTFTSTYPNPGIIAAMGTGREKQTARQAGTPAGAGAGSGRP
jgi:catalase